MAASRSCRCSGPAGKTGEYSGAFHPAATGRYRVEARVSSAEPAGGGTESTNEEGPAGDGEEAERSAGGTPVSAFASFEAGRVDDEFFDAEADLDLLSRIAEATGGRVFGLDEGERLALDLSLAASGATVVERRDLWNAPAPVPADLRPAGDRVESPRLPEAAVSARLGAAAPDLSGAPAPEDSVGIPLGVTPRRTGRLRRGGILLVAAGLGAASATLGGASPALRGPEGNGPLLLVVAGVGGTPEHRERFFGLGAGSLRRGDFRAGAAAGAGAAGTGGGAGRRSGSLRSRRPQHARGDRPTDRGGRRRARSRRGTLRGPDRARQRGSQHGRAGGPVQSAGAGPDAGGAGADCWTRFPPDR